MTHEYMIKTRGAITMHTALQLHSLHLKTARDCGELENIKERELPFPLRHSACSSSTCSLHEISSIWCTSIEWMEQIIEPHPIPLACMWQWLHLCHAPTCQNGRKRNQNDFVQRVQQRLGSKSCEFRRINSKYYKNKVRILRDRKLKCYES